VDRQNRKLASTTCEQQLKFLQKYFFQIYNFVQLLNRFWTQWFIEILVNATISMRGIEWLVNSWGLARWAGGYKSRPQRGVRSHIPQLLQTVQTLDFPCLTMPEGKCNTSRKTCIFVLSVITAIVCLIGVVVTATHLVGQCYETFFLGQRAICFIPGKRFQVSFTWIWERPH
jgi:hypothetical protein